MHCFFVTSVKQKPEDVILKRLLFDYMICVILQHVSKYWIASNFDNADTFAITTDDDKRRLLQKKVYKVERYSVMLRLTGDMQISLTISQMSTNNDV